jgi:hypothetical protein
MNLAENAVVTWRIDPASNQRMLDHRKRLNPDATPLDETKQQLKDILLGGLANRTLDFEPLKPGYYQELAVRFVQFGDRYDIFLVRAISANPGNDDEFVVAASQGGEKRDQELVDDYKNLGDAYKQLDKQDLPIFVPKPYVANLQGFYQSPLRCFSMQNLSQHMEVNSRDFSELTEVAKPPYTYFFMHSSDPLLGFDHEYSSMVQHMMKSDVIEAVKKLGEDDPSAGYEVGNSDHYKGARRIKEAMVSRLFLLYHVLGGVPKEFAVNAGDFMADPEKNDFDLKLITIRGGLEELPSEEAFRQWALDHNERLRRDREPDYKYPLFDKNPAIVDKGIRNAQEAISKARLRRSWY